MRDSKMSAAERQIHALYVYTACVERDRSLPLSQQLRRDADAGNRWAKAVIASGIFFCRSSPSKLPAPFRCVLWARTPVGIWPNLSHCLRK